MLDLKTQSIKAITKLINNSAKISRPANAHVSMNLEMNNMHGVDTYNLCRKWVLAESLTESFAVSKNGVELTADEIADFEKYILSLLPPELFNLYFFDGEKIADFFLNEGSGTRIKEAFLTLCGYDTFDIMRKNFKRISANSSSSTPELDEYLYVFKLRTDKWSTDCNNLIVDFFSTVINSIRNKRTVYAKKLLEQLGEPRETHLGVSRGSISGKGVSGKQANDLYNKLSTSKAVASGRITDISDCELMIPGIGFDKVSDITTNIIRDKLITYTQEQCRLYGIPMRSIPSGRIWSPIEKRWLNGSYVDLPVVEGKKILLVPKCCVVFKMTLSSKELYDKDIVEYIQAEQIAAMSSLVEVLKNGKRRVTKKSIKENPEYRMTKEFIYSFCDRHPEVLEQYKSRKRITSIEAIDINEISEKTVAESLANALCSVTPGNEEASQFHSVSIGILEFLFFPDLMYPRKEHEVNEGRKRIDITFNNSSSGGFWNQIRTAPDINASMIMVECKNYTSDIKNPELDQMSGRFSHQRGWFGIILCRQFENKELFTKRCKDTASDGRGIIICLDDTDILTMLEMIKNGERKKINEYMIKRYQEIIS